MSVNAYTLSANRHFFNPLNTSIITNNYQDISRYIAYKYYMLRLRGLQKYYRKLYSFLFFSFFPNDPTIAVKALSCSIRS